MALFTGAFFVAQVSLIIVAKPFLRQFFCTSCVPHHENPRIIVGKVVENFLHHFTGFYEVIQKYWRNKEK